MIRIEQIDVADTIERVMPLIAMHYKESSRTSAALKPDVAKYAAMEEQGQLIGLGAFDERALIGYCVTIMSQHLHYMDMVIADNDVLFVAPQYRKSGVGQQLIDETNRLAVERGAKTVVWHAKEGTALEAMLRGDGYRVQDILFSKEF